ncbi:hypothetical protein J1N35_032572 [Gossypium stocksii]|uniref:Uncharacterized protein n=1 Tax=Gossypium stocksii TaxID=47602 RepID=A0A9D3ZWD6_9ROSI|nr:hypothetical protein J1N35_032572 [Gossypium stocksii]
MPAQVSQAKNPENTTDQAQWLGPKHRHHTQRKSGGSTGKLPGGCRTNRRQQTHHQWTPSECEAQDEKDVEINISANEDRMMGEPWSKRPNNQS